MSDSDDFVQVNETTSPSPAVPVAADVDTPASPVASPNNDAVPPPPASAAPVIEEAVADATEGVTSAAAAVASAVTSAAESATGGSSTRSSTTKAGADTPAGPVGAGAGAGVGAGAGAGSSGPAPSSSAPINRIDLTHMTKAVKCVATNQSLHPYISWRDPITSGGAFAGILAFFTIFVWMGVTLPTFVFFVAGLALAASGLGKSLQNIGKPVPMLPLAPLSSSADAERVASTVTNAVSAVVNTKVKYYIRLRELLTWQDFYQSMRALVITWLLFRYSCVFSLCTAFILFIALFTLPALYERNQAAVDNILATKVTPILEKVGVQALRVSERAVFNHAAVAFIVGFLVSWYFGLFSLSGWLEFSAWTFLALDALPTLRPHLE